jgi:gas vesicle protein
MAIALVAAPYPGQETRRRLGQQVDKMKRQGEDQIEQIKTAKSSSSVNGGVSGYTTPTTAYERTSS